MYLEGSQRRYSELLGELGFSISESKTKVCVFSRSRKTFRSNVEINGVPISVSNKVKY